MHASISRRTVLGMACILLTLAVLGANAQNAGALRSPVGAKLEGNADGSIPPWNGGLRAPPSGWQPGQGYVDPFGDEKPLATVSGNNLAEMRDR